MSSHMRFGVFLAPYHNDRESPTFQIHRDLELAQHLDRLGFDEMWIGEHHSGSFEMIPSPELFIAAAAERTRRLRLGTGVISLPYHQPLMVADRITQLSHQTLGRFMFGVGPGQLPSDAHMIGVPVDRQRERMVEALDVILPLLRGETVTRRSDWFELNDARVQLLPYSDIEVAVASAISPSGPRTAGRFGLSMLSMAASAAEGFSVLPQHWAVCEQLAAEHGQQVDRSGWRLVAPIHLAETREQALQDVSWGILDLVHYLERLGGQEPSGITAEQAVETWTQEGMTIFGTATIGTPDDAVARIESFQKQSGGFGTLLLLATDCASPERTLKSYELFARYVMPEIRKANANRHASLAWCSEHSTEIVGKVRAAIGQAIRDHEEERAARGGEGVPWADRSDLLVGSEKKS